MCFEYSPCQIGTRMKLTAKDMNKTGSAFFGRSHLRQKNARKTQKNAKKTQKMGGE
jgi:hypothetical protein